MTSAPSRTRSATSVRKPSDVIRTASSLVPAGVRLPQGAEEHLAGLGPPESPCLAPALLRPCSGLAPALLRPCSGLAPALLRPCSGLAQAGFGRGDRFLRWLRMTRRVRAG